MSAEPLASIPNPRVQNGTWVTDMAGAPARRHGRAPQSTRSATFERTHGIEMAVVVIRSLDGSSIEEAAGSCSVWGIGKKDRDNGLLFLWSTGDRRVRVEVGYGLEGVLPDGKVGAILDAYVIPRFKAVSSTRVSSRASTRCWPRREMSRWRCRRWATESYDSSGWLSWLPLLGSIPVGSGRSPGSAGGGAIAA